MYFTLNLFVWDPTEPVATRPLFTTGSGNRKFFYTCDGNKNVSEMVHFEQRNGIAAHYDYAPFGAVTRAISASTITDNTFTTDNPFRFSSEYHDDTLGLVYYNYRHCNPIDGRWISRDRIVDINVINLFAFITNSSIDNFDYIGDSKRPSRNANRKGHSKNASRSTKDKHEKAQRHGGRTKPNFTPRPSRTIMNARTPLTHPCVVGIMLGDAIVKTLSNCNFFDEEIDASIVMVGPETCVEPCKRLLVESIHVRRWTDFTWSFAHLSDISVAIEVEDIFYLRFACCNRIGRKTMAETYITQQLEDRSMLHEAFGTGFYQKIVEQWECL